MKRIWADSTQYSVGRHVVVRVALPNALALLAGWQSGQVGRARRASLVLPRLCVAQWHAPRKTVTCQRVKCVQRGQKLARPSDQGD